MFLPFCASLQEVIVKGLAESRTFQRMALKTHTTLEELTNKGNQHLESTLNEIHKVASDTTTSTAAGRPQPPLRGVSGFIAAFAKELRHDITTAIGK
jgi:hypothetical protein